VKRIVPIFNAVVLPRRTPPATSNCSTGLVVPIPTFPFANTVKIGELEPTAKSSDVPFAVDEATLRTAYGVDVPTPKRPLVASQKNFVLSWVSAPDVPVNMTEPFVRVDR
jgi:hypothetical protein